MHYLSNACFVVDASSTVTIPPTSWLGCRLSPCLWSLQFGPLEETYSILAKFEVAASEEEQKMLQDLQQAGEDFKEMLKEVEQARYIARCPSLLL